MKALRYSLLLPLIHLAIAIPLIYREESRNWAAETHLIQTLDAIERAAEVARSGPAPSQPSASPRVGWDPISFDYRPTISVKAIYTVEWPAGMLVGWYMHPPSLYFGGALQYMLPRLVKRLEGGARIVLLDCVLLLAIWAQWWLVGCQLDRLQRQRQKMRVWALPVAVITVGGIVMAVLSRSSGTWELIAILSGLLGFFAWLALLLMFAVTAVRSAMRFSRRARATE